SRASSAFWFYNNTKREWTEIDVFEICGVGSKWKHTYNMDLHVFHSPTQKEHWSRSEKWKAPFDFVDDYHIYALEWSELMIKWYVDGKLIRKAKNTHWHQPLHMNFDSEVMTNWFGFPAKKDLPSTFSIEYIRSWKKSNDSSETGVHISKQFSEE
ncbi:family 16 glycosylhydrolase, partial [Verrucomicrobiota bacterium]